MKDSTVISSLEDKLRIERDYPLSELTTMGVGGPADWVAFCRSAENIVEVVDLCRRHAIDYFILGGGSNVIAGDKGYRGVVIVNQIEKFKIDGDLVTCGAGLPLRELVERTVTAGRGGLESLAGIAGTVGGAIAGNAGAYGCSIADVLLDVELLIPGTGFVTAAAAELEFGYRRSNLKSSGKVILSGRFKLKRADADQLKERIAVVLRERWKKLPREDISAGCFFKNIEKADAPHGKLAAGQLLDQVGAKQMSVGNAGVYAKHANVIVNKGGATASEIRRLAAELKLKVKDRFDIDLVEEVVFLGDFS